MTRAARLLRNIFANWLGFAVSAVVTLLLTPFVLQQLGEVRYSVWVISFSIIGYYGLLDLGFRGSINQYLTRYIAVLDYEGASACMSTATLTLAALGGALAVMSIGVAYAVPLVWNVPAGMERETFWCILIVGLTSALQFVFFPYTAVFTAMQRFDLANLIGISSRLLTALCIYLALSRGFGLIGISAVTCAVSLADYVVRWRVARRLAPLVRVERRLVSRSHFAQLISFGTWTFLISLNAYLYLHAQPLLIGALLPISAVAYYTLATGLSQQINGVLSPIGQVIYPAATSLHARSDRQSLERLYHDGTRLMLLVMVPIVLIAWFWAEDFYRLWIGEKYVSSIGPMPSVALLLQVLLGATVTNFFSNIAGQILTGAGLLKRLALLLVCGSVLNLGLSVALIGPFGLVGVAVATVAASVVIDLIAKPFALQFAVGLRVLPMLRNALPRPALTAAILLPAFAALKATGQSADWSALIAHGFAAGLLALTALLSIGITREERKRFLIEPVRQYCLRHAGFRDGKWRGASDGDQK